MEKIKAVLSGHSSHDADHPTTHSSTSGTKTPEVSAPGAYPTDRTKVAEGSTNTSKLGGSHHHDPEAETKEATSAAGNYPYWGDIPKEGEPGYVAGATSHGTHGTDSTSHARHGTGLAAGTGAAGLATGAAAAGHRGSDYEHRSLGESGSTSTTERALGSSTGTHGSTTHHDLTDRTRGDNLQTSADHPGAKVAAATGVGAAGATLLGTRAQHDETTARGLGAGTGATSAGHGNFDPTYTSQTGGASTLGSASAPHTGSSSLSNTAVSNAPYTSSPSSTTHQTTSTGTPQSFTNIDNTSYAPREGDHTHRNEALAAGAGAAGLGGAGYLASKHHNKDDHSRTSEPLSQQQRNTTTSGLGSSSHPTTTTAAGGVHNTVIGAGSSEDAHAHQRTHQPSFNSSALGASNTGSGAVDSREHSSVSNALGGAGSNTTRSGDDRRNLAGAAGAGALGAGAVAAEEKHRHGHHHETDNTHQHDKHHAQSSHTTTQPAAARAAQQAWNKQNQGTSGAGLTSGSGVNDSRLNDAEKATSAAGNYPHRSGENTSSSHHGTTALGAGAGVGLAGAAATAAHHGHNSNQGTTGTSGSGLTSGSNLNNTNLTEAEKATSAAGNYPHRSGGDNALSSSTNNPSSSSTTHHSGSALGPAAGVGGLAGAGATAAYYGQGREHDNNPRSDVSSKVAERALGSDGGAHGPLSAEQESGRSFPLAEHNSSSRTGGVGATSLSGAGGAGGFPSGGSSAPVIHQCNKCGADNDISEFVRSAASKFGH